MRNVDTLRTYFLSILRRATRADVADLDALPKPSFVAGADGSMQLINDLNTAVAVFSGGASGSDYIELIAGNAVSPPQVHSAGASTDVSLDITTQGVGAVSIYGGDATSGDTAGGAVTLVSGDGFGAGAGATASLTGGNGGDTGAGGPVVIQAGPGGATSGTGGALSMLGGAGSGGNAVGGATTLRAGSGNGSGTGGSLTVAGGNAGTTGLGGAATFRGGDGGATSGVGGSATFRGGDAQGANSAGGFATVRGGAATGNAAGGHLDLSGGIGGATGAGGTLVLSGGRGGATSGNGGSVGITGGFAFNGGSNGGAVTIAGGAGNAAGIGGNVTISPGNSGTAANRGNINFTDQAGVNVVGVQKNADGSAYCLAATAATDLAGGNITINAITGKFRIAAGQSAVTITCNRCVAASSTVILTKYAGVADATMTNAQAVAGAGSFVVTGNAACTGNVDWQFLVINAVA